METLNLTKQQKLDILTKDFLERDGDRFVKIRRTGRLGWEETLPKYGVYSSYILDCTSPEELISRAYELARNMITVMDSDKKVQIKITSDDSATDASTVWVATKVFDEPELSVGQKLDAFLGFAIHEGCHLLYTDFGAMKNITNRTVHSLQNIIEDERIERLCGETKPGLVNFVGATKYYSFDKFRQRLQGEGRFNNLSKTERLINCILSYVRYPKALTVSELEEFSDLMLQVKDILTPYPESTSESIKVAERIYELIKQQSKESKQQEAGKGQAGSDESSDNTEHSSGNQGGNCDGTLSEDDKELERELSAFNDAMEEICQNPKTGLCEDDQSATVKADGGKAGKVCEGMMERGLIKGSYIEKAGEDKCRYNNSLDRVRRYIPAIANALKLEGTDVKFCVKGQRSGLLDTGKLAEARQGVQTVYSRRGEIKSTRMSVCILLDESGSMWGTGEEAARDTAILLNEALSKVPNVDLYIYGHTASRSTTNLFVYREKGFSKRYALGSTDSRAGNHDSIAIREAAARVRRSTKEDCLFFVISDGAPNESTELVRKAVEDVEKDGFQVVAISIDPYYDPSTMYSHNVTLYELSTLAIELGKLVKKAVQKNNKRRIII